MKLPSIRYCYGVGALLCCFMLGFAIYLQLAQGLAPCPLCQLQRLVFIILGILFLVALLQNPGPRMIKWYGYLVLGFSIAGGAIALRQLWLQNAPHPIDENCGVGMQYLLGALPLTQAIKVILQGSGDCAEVHWRFLGLTLPAWSFVGYVTLALLAIWQNFRLRSHMSA